jgi:hypothetical protein
MSFRIQKVDYFYASVHDEPGEAYKILTLLAEMDINLLAFTAFPTGPMKTQLALFPQDANKLGDHARKAGLDLDGPHHAILVQGDDELGALATVHANLYRSNVNVYASTGVSDGKGSYGYVLYLKPEDLDRAVEALEL